MCTSMLGMSERKVGLYHSLFTRNARWEPAEKHEAACFHAIFAGTLNHAPGARGSPRLLNPHPEPHNYRIVGVERVGHPGY